MESRARARSETFSRNESRIAAADVKTVLSEVLQVNILRTINFGSDRELQAAWYFLEKCCSSVSLSSELNDFLKDIACCKTETLVTTREKLRTVVKKLSELLEVRQQAVIMASQVDKLIQNTSVLSHSAVTEDQCAFDWGKPDGNEVW